jgi:hypothetical protein
MRGHVGLALSASLVGLLGCGTSPTAPAPGGQANFDPAALFERLAGFYTLTFVADEGCALPPSLRVLTYDVAVERSPYRYLGVRVQGKDIVGDLWIFGTEEQGFTFRWNTDCEALESVGATSFRLCGEGTAPVTHGVISGVLQPGFYRDSADRPYCANGAHRFEFRRRD